MSAGTQPMDPNITLENYRSRFLILYGIEEGRFAEVISSVTAHSVMIFGIAEGGSPCRLIALIPLSEPVDPDQTATTYEHDHLVLTLMKSQPETSRSSGHADDRGAGRGNLELQHAASDAHHRLPMRSPDSVR